MRGIAAGLFVVRPARNDNEWGNTMAHEDAAYRRPYRRGDYHLVDTTRDGTYWRSPEGVVVRMASAENERATLHRAAPAWTFAFLALARLARP